MPKFGQPAGQRTANRNRAMYISNFKDQMTVTRFLWEDPDVTWYAYPEHFDHASKISFPCVSRLADFPYCVGCTMPVLDEFEEDPEARNKDLGWTIRRVTTRFVVPTLNEKGFITLRKVSGTFKDQMAGHYKVMHSITAADWTISRSGSGFDTKFTASPTGQAMPRKYTDELRQLYLTLAEHMKQSEGGAAYEQAWAQWNAGNSELGVPNTDALDAILGQKYAEALGKYEIPDEELARRHAIRAAAEALIKSQDGAPDAPAASLALVPPLASPPAVPAQAVASPTVETANADALTELGQLAADLQKWGVPFPMDATLEQMRMLHTTFAATRGQQAAATPTVAEPAAPAPAAAAPPAAAEPAAAYEAQPPAATEMPPPTGGDLPPFEEWGSGDVRDWLTEHNVPWDRTMPRSKLISLAKQSVTGF